VVAWVRHYRQMSEHRKDLVFLTMKYWGFLKPESLFAHLLLILVLLALYGLIFYPDTLVRLTGSDLLRKWIGAMHGTK
jgi:hypothetical protein